MMNKKILLFFSTLSILYLNGCVTIYNPATEQKETYFISEETEIDIGKNMVEDIIRQNKILEDKELAAYLNEIGQNIARASHRNTLAYEFYVLDDDKINAFALPGGFVFVNKGLLDQATEDELAFVLSHEVGHISARHSLKRLQSSLGISLLLGIALRNPNQQTIRGAINVVHNVIALGYSRKDELLADSLGINYVNKAGYDPQAAISLIEKLGKKDKNQPLVFLRSHPLPDQRLANIKKELKALEKD
jgi:predicted Zn-dependent protease